MLGEKKVLKWGVATGALLLLFLLPDGCTVRAKGLFRNLVIPVQSACIQGGRRLKAGVDSVRELGGLEEENRRLYKTVVELQAESRVRGTLEEENIRLRKLLEFSHRQTTQLIAAEVASRSISSWWQIIYLAKGSTSGIFKNRAVISPDGLVGRTSTITKGTTEVRLVSDPACKISARISRTGAFGLVQGHGVNVKGYPVAQMKFIHKNTPIKVGDAVVTSGLGGVFPMDILIGYIETIRTEDSDLYQVAEILPQAVMNLTDVVFITNRRGEGE